MPETETMLVIGSTTTTSGRRLLTSFCIPARCPSRPVLVGRTAWKCNKPFIIHGSRLMPTERMLRMIWSGDSCGHAGGGSFVRQCQRGDGQHRDAIVVDHVRVFIGAVGSAPVLDDAQPPGGNLLVDPMVQQDHAIGDVFFESVTG